MELKNTEDLRNFLRNTIHERWTNVTAISKKANVAQPSFQKFIKGTNGKSISTYTMFPILEALGKKLVAIDSDMERYGHKTIVVDTERLFADMVARGHTIDLDKQNMEALSRQHVLPNYLNDSAQPEKVTKESLSSELRNRIEEYKSAPEPKDKFSVDLIIEFFEESYDKLVVA